MFFLKKKLWLLKLCWIRVVNSCHNQNILHALLGCSKSREHLPPSSVLEITMLSLVGWISWLVSPWVMNAWGRMLGGIVFFWDSGWGWMMGASDIFWEIYRLQLRHSKIERNELASTQMPTKDKTHRKNKNIFVLKHLSILHLLQAAQK